LTERRSLSERRRLLEPQIDKLIVQSRQLGLKWEDVLAQLQQRNAEISPQEQRT
jgi:hypothetical protein